MLISWWFSYKISWKIAVNIIDSSNWELVLECPLFNFHGRDVKPGPGVCLTFLLSHPGTSCCRVLNFSLIFRLRLCKRNIYIHMRGNSIHRKHGCRNYLRNSFIHVVYREHIQYKPSFGANPVQTKFWCISTPASIIWYAIQHYLPCESVFLGSETSYLLFVSPSHCSCLLLCPARLNYKKMSIILCMPWGSLLPLS